jgi:hypothetical protein
VHDLLDAGIQVDAKDFFAGLWNFFFRVRHIFPS